MPEINFFWRRGVQYAKWPGTSYRDENGKIQKKKQIYIGKVLDKDKKIFFNNKYGVCTFDTNTHTIKELEQNLIPQINEEINKTKKELSDLFDFGDIYFLHQFIDSIEYFPVLHSIRYGNMDRIDALLSYYILSKESNRHADQWFRGSFARYLFPKAHLVSQRCSDALLKIGEYNNYKRFISSHISYVLDIIRGKLKVAFDTTGLPNSCSMYITRLSNHFGIKNIECRLALVFELSTGLPIYFEIIEGNIIDKSITERIIKNMEDYDCHIDYILTDAGCITPKMMNRLSSSGIDYMTRLSENYKLHKNTVEENINKLNDLTNTVRYKDRFIVIVEVEVTIGKDEKTCEDIKGYIYLCRDTKQFGIQLFKLQDSKKIKNLTTDEFIDVYSNLGVFSFISTERLSTKDVLPTYYTRLGIEQYIDYAKNYTKMLPVSQHDIDSIRGHLILSFSGSFLITLIKNRLNILDCNYVVLPTKYENNDSLSCNEVSYTEGDEIIIEQESNKIIYKESTSTLFYELRGQKAAINGSVITPSYAIPQARMFYDCFMISIPYKIYIRDNPDGQDCCLDFRNKDNSVTQSTLTKLIIFARRPTVSDEEIRKNRNFKTRQSTSEGDNTSASNQRKRKGKHLRTVEREEYIRSQGKDPNSTEGRKLVKRLRVAEKTVEDAGYPPYSPEGKRILHDLLNGNNDVTSHDGDDNSCIQSRRGRAKTEICKNREEYVISLGIDIESSEGRKLIKQLRNFENVLKSDNIDPYSNEGKCRLNDLLDSTKSEESENYRKLSRSKSTNIIQRENYIKSNDIDPNSEDGRTLIRKLYNIEKRLISDGIDQNSSDWNEVINEFCRLYKECIIENGQDKKEIGTNNRLKSIQTIEREIFLRSEGILHDSHDNRRILNLLRDAEKKIKEEGFHPYSAEGKIKLKEMLKNHIDVTDGRVIKSTQGRPVGSKNHITIEREYIIRSLNIDLDSIDARNMINRLRLIENELRSKGIYPYSEDGKKCIFEKLRK